MFAALEHVDSTNRRNNGRVEKPFPITYSLDGGRNWTPAYGLNISLGGVCVLVKKRFLGEQVSLRMTLDSSMCEMRVKPVWSIAGLYQNELAYHGMQFTAATAGDLERIQRWLAGQMSGVARVT